MPFKPPLKILITTDDNQIQFMNIRMINKETHYVYKFVKSETKVNKEVVFTEAELSKQLNSFFKVI